MVVRNLSDHHVSPAEGAQPFDSPSPTTQITSRGPHPQLLRISPLSAPSSSSTTWIFVLASMRGIDGGDWRRKSNSPVDKSDGESQVDLSRVTWQSVNGSGKSSESRQASVLQSPRCLIVIWSILCRRSRSTLGWATPPSLPHIFPQYTGPTWTHVVSPHPLMHCHVARRIPPGTLLIISSDKWPCHPFVILCHSIAPRPTSDRWPRRAQRLGLKFQPGPLPISASTNWMLCG